MSFKKVDLSFQSCKVVMKKAMSSYLVYQWIGRQVLDLVLDLLAIK